MPSLQSTFTHISSAPEQPLAKITSLGSKGAAGVLYSFAIAVRANKVPIYTHTFINLMYPFFFYIILPSAGGYPLDLKLFNCFATASLILGSTLKLPKIVGSPNDRTRQYLKISHAFFFFFF